ncbi:CLCA domain-containing protein [Caerostris extrusa]|uniref:CLCA domain-containing protein n=1 Tax=Caerostris extrusa TaxID=172846 RepID=A0AAV4M5G9_CAEEX|nr:CLCA domain-containing protein [Caerostris extrusa]
MFVERFITHFSADKLCITYLSLLPDIIVRCNSVRCLALQLAVNAEVKVENHAYENVLVSFARNVPNDKGQELIESIKKHFEDTSLALHTAVGIRIGTVTIRLPSTWSISPSEDEVIHPSSAEQTEEKSDILVDATEDSAFGKQPIALQYGGCGVKGHQVTVPLQFLNSSEDYPKRIALIFLLMRELPFRRSLILIALHLRQIRGNLKSI